MGLFSRDSVKSKLKSVVNSANKELQSCQKDFRKATEKEKKQTEVVQKIQEDCSKWVESKYPGGHDAYESHREMELEELQNLPKDAKKAYEFVRQVIGKLSEANAKVLELNRAKIEAQRKVVAARKKAAQAAKALQEYVDKKATAEKEMDSADYKQWRESYKKVAQIIKDS